jgi:DNA mismatch repair protein MutS
MSIAWAVAEYLHDLHGKGVKTLFATHYFELTTLPETLSNVANIHLDAVEHGDSIVFMHSVKDGPANQSYGLQVAALAGVPKAVIERAKTRLFQLEESSAASTSITEKTLKPANGNENQRQFSLFDNSVTHPAIEQLKSLELDTLTPREALQILYELQDKIH